MIQQGERRHTPTNRSPHCPDCHRRFEPGTSWSHANFCRASYLIPIIAKHPGVSAWELAEKSGLPYGDVGRAILKAREYGPLHWEEEPRENGEGFRYRYRAVPNWKEIVDTQLHCPWRREKMVGAWA